MIAWQQDRAVKPSANGHNIHFIYIYHGHNIVGQQLPTLLDVTCYIHLHSLMHLVGSCCAKFETGPTFESTTPNISLGSATKLDTFAQIFQHSWGHARTKMVVTILWLLAEFALTQ